MSERDAPRKTPLRSLTVPKRPSASRSTHVYEFFDSSVLGRLWFVAVTDGESVQMLAPTFRSERAARIFDYCYSKHPEGFLLSIDGQLELARRIEQHLPDLTEEAALRRLCEGLTLERTAP